MASKKEKKLCTLVNKLNNPVLISYEGKGLIIPPKGKAKKLDPDKIGAIPKGVFKI